MNDQSIAEGHRLVVCIFIATKNCVGARLITLMVRRVDCEGLHRESDCLIGLTSGSSFLESFLRIVL